MAHKSKKAKKPVVNYGAIMHGLLQRDGALDGRFLTKKVPDKRRKLEREACKKQKWRAEFA